MASDPRLAMLATATADPDSAELLDEARGWVESELAPGAAPSIPVTLQGVRIFWSPDRVAFLAPPDRVEQVRLALVETCFYEAELRSLESWLGDGWKRLESDAPLAFEFRDPSPEKRAELGQQFRAVISVRARLARLQAWITSPPMHPPTLAHQIGERLRERTRMAERWETASTQSELFERVYDSCSQRVNDFVHHRSGNTLEWIIIVLLLMQTILVVVELLSSAGG